jgi:hypothetical protein
MTSAYDSDHGYVQSVVNQQSCVRDAHSDAVIHSQPIAKVIGRM